VPVSAQPTEVESSIDSPVDSFGRPVDDGQAHSSRRLDQERKQLAEARVNNSEHGGAVSKVVDEGSIGPGAGREPVGLSSKPRSVQVMMFWGWLMRASAATKERGIPDARGRWRSLQGWALRAGSPLVGAPARTCGR